jgi:methionyl-tRNA formyltransferase
MTTALNLVFGGTPAFAVPALEALLAAGHRVAAVYTQPDRPAGRGQQLQMSAVKECALKNGLPVEQPRTLRDSDAATQLAKYRPDAMIVVAYGLLLPQIILDVPRLGCINIHGSLLPRWRGAAPIQRALLAGDSQTGISIMRMEAGLDTGPVLSLHPIAIGERESAAELYDRLAKLGADALCETLQKYAAGERAPTPQPQEGATYAQKIRKEEALIDWTQSARDIDRKVRAFNPWPVAETRWRDQQLRIWQSMPIASANARSPGQVIDATNEGVLVATGDGVLRIERLQLAGRKSMSASEFIRAQPIAGAQLGAP